jgi:hypothetical protein
MQMRSLLIIFLVCLSLSLFGAETDGNIFWIQFNTKTGTSYRIDKPELYLSQRAIERRARHNIEIDSTDLPINPGFTDSLRSMGFYIKHTSRWMNGAIAIYPDTLSVDSIQLPSFISFIQLRKDAPLKSLSTKFDEIDSLARDYYGNSTDQITMLNGHLLHKHSKGEGVHVAVIDGGFFNADKLDVFDSLYARDGILGTRDFAAPGNNVYNEMEHGTNVLSIMAANNPGLMVGAAPEASYWLLRSEVHPGESPVEEDYWVIATEFADSVGCDVINTSLGYTIFDNPQFNHNYGEFSGDSIRISKAANLAVKKGVVVVCSAGNDGANSWRHICAPSEARDVLSVAAVNYNRNVTNFSSRGFGIYSSVQKPDISAMGGGTAIISANGDYSYGSGTSFSAPLIAGMAACMVGAFPDSSATSIIKMIREAGHLYPQHTDSLGYGIPDFAKYNDQIPLSCKSCFTGNNTVKAFPNPFSSKFCVVSKNEIERIDIYTFDGQKIFSAFDDNPVLKGKTVTSLEYLPKGIYFAVIHDQLSVQTLKLIKK